MFVDEIAQENMSRFSDKSQLCLLQCHIQYCAFVIQMVQTSYLITTDCAKISLVEEFTILSEHAGVMLGGMVVSLHVLLHWGPL